MANIQRQFIQFDDAIRLRHFDENATLREKRDAVLDRLKDRLVSLRKEGHKIPRFEWFLQGSYEMGTGIYPAEGDYDIDVGLYFECPRTAFEDPVALKALVHKALDGHTQKVVVRRSCVTVYYQRAGEHVYHVDLAVYAQEPQFLWGHNFFIAKGKLNSLPEHRLWEPSDPQELTRWVSERFSDREDEQQFLRIVRALKRWKGENFKSDGASAPSGIALTIVAGKYFKPKIDRPLFFGKNTADDLNAMLCLVDAMVGAFESVEKTSEGVEQFRLIVTTPVGPEKNLCERMTVPQMTALRRRLVGLKTALEATRENADVMSACNRMREEFGPEFPGG